jgi:hypothetical protein
MAQTRAPGKTRMQAIVQDTYGSTDVLALRDIAKPVPKENQVLVRVEAAGLDRGVVHVMTGLPYLIRLLVPSLGLHKPKVPVLGMDLAGRVEAIGQQVTRFRPGDAVFGWTDTAPTPSTPPCPRITWRPCRPTSASSRPRPCPSPASPPSRPSATRARSSLGKRCWSSGRRAAWGRSRSSWPRRSGPR